MTRAGSASFITTSPVSPEWAATLLAEATLPAAMIGRVHLVRQVAKQAEELWEDNGATAAGRQSPGSVDTSR
jgi:hypothetical protein